MQRILNLQGPHGYIYGRWTNQYIRVLLLNIIPRLKPAGKKWLSDRYHGKVLTEEQAKSIITLNRNIPLQDLEHIIPYPMARDIVLNGPPDVVAYECGCRHTRSNSCQPTQVCMVIGKPFVDFILEHNPKSSRRLSQSEALELLEAEHKRGHVHSAWFKDAMLDRFYVICNCCKCCCGGIEAMTKYGIPMLASSGYIAKEDKDLCSACGTCVNACPFDAVSLGEEGAALDWRKCMGCGACIEPCPNGARSLVRDERKGEPLDLRLLAKEATQTR
ncbi:MAG: 4Fe-4S binding protein [Candidatus Sulfobium sp.]